MMVESDRQNSQGSSIASEKILAVRNDDSAVQIRAPVDLEDAERHEQRITTALATLKQKLASLLASCPSDPKQRTPAEAQEIADLAKGLEQIKVHQSKLKQDMIYARDERRKLLVQQKKSAMKVGQAKSAPPVRMEELRAMNVTKLDENDLRARYELAQKPKPIIPSGGFTGFRVAPDLAKMDFSHSDPNHPDKVEAWRPEVQIKLAKKGNK